MDIKIIQSVSYIEFINKITEIFNKLLYSEDDGYLNTKSKTAIQLAQKTLKKFDYEVSKVCQDLNVSNVQDVIENKKRLLITTIKNHCNSEIKNYVDEVFDEFTDNLLFELSIDKLNSKVIYDKLIQAINWYCNIQKINSLDKEKLYNAFDKKFDSVLNSKDSDYLSSNDIKKTDWNYFLVNWNLILDNEIEFVNRNFILDNKKLIDEDIKYFIDIQNKLKSYLRQNVIDEINLIRTVILNYDFKNEQAYILIKQLYYDFKYNFEKQKNISEEDKIRIIKRRIKLSKDNNKIKKYYIDLINSLNE